MHVLVATDGSIDIEKTARFANALAGSDGNTTVVTIVAIPRQLLPELRTKWGAPAEVHVDTDDEYVGSPDPSGSLARSWPRDDAMIDQYLGDKRIAHCKPMSESIRALGGQAESDAKEGHDVADGLMEFAAELEIDVIVIGSHGHGRFQGLLGSTGAKLVRRAKRPVLVIR